MSRNRFVPWVAALGLVLGACDRPAPAPAAPAASPQVETPTAAALPPPASAPPASTQPVYPPVEPPAPGQPGGLADDRTPLSEAPFTPQSAQGAATVVQTYFALISQHDYAKAWRLWARGGEASGMTEAQFVASFDKYLQYDAQVGGPGQMEGAAGSSYVEAPVVIYGRLKTGEPVHLNGPVVLRRTNDVPGSTAEQRLWRIDRMTLAGPQGPN